MDAWIFKTLKNDESDYILCTKQLFASHIEVRYFFEKGKEYIDTQKKWDRIKEQIYIER
jgi:hypothetical protein